MGRLLALLAWAAFGGDVGRLGDPQFATRLTAGERLRSAGWLAYPALLAGSQDASAERANRCGELLDRLDGWLSLAADVEAVARGVVPLPEWADDVFMTAVCRRVDQLGGWRTSDSWAWVRVSPYHRGSRWGDCDHAVRSAVISRTLPVLGGGLAVPK